MLHLGHFTLAPASFNSRREVSRYSSINLYDIVRMLKRTDDRARVAERRNVCARRSGAADGLLSAYSSGSAQVSAVRSATARFTVPPVSAPSCLM